MRGWAACPPEAESFFSIHYQRLVPLIDTQRPAGPRVAGANWKPSYVRGVREGTSTFSSVCHVSSFSPHADAGMRHSRG